MDEGNIVAYFTGYCEPKNPAGNMAIGAVIKFGGKTIYTFQHFIPESWENSVNVAEYLAIESIFDFFEANNLRGQVHICSDSKFVIYQLREVWAVNFGRYVKYAKRCKKKLQDLRDRGIHFTLQHVSPGQNEAAHELCRMELVKNNVMMKVKPISKEEHQRLVEKVWETRTSKRKKIKL